MTNTTNGHPAPRAARPARFRSAPLPDAPPASAHRPDRASLLRAQEEILGGLVREDLARGRGFAFLVCAAVVTFVVGVVPVMVVDASEAEGSDSTEVAVSLVLGLVLLAVLAVPALLVLRALRRRSVRRFGLMRQWAAVDRGHDTEFPTRFGVHGYPHARFFYAAVVLVLAVVLSVAVLADVSDTGVLALLPCLVVAGVFAWSVARKYAGRYGWATRERLERVRAQRRERHRARLGDLAAAPVEVTVARPAGVHPALLYAALLAPAVIVTLVFVVVRPEEALGLAVAAVLALAVLVLGLPKVLLVRRRERTELRAAADGLTPAFSAGAVPLPVRYGLAEADTVGANEAGPRSWDAGPSRTGALAVGRETLRLRGADGAALDLPLHDVAGVVLVPSGVAWVADSVDVLLTSGAGIECLSPEAEAIMDAFIGAGVQVLKS